MIATVTFIDLDGASAVMTGADEMAERVADLGAYIRKTCEAALVESDVR